MMLNLITVDLIRLHPDIIIIWPQYILCRIKTGSVGSAEVVLCINGSDSTRNQSPSIVGNLSLKRARTYIAPDHFILTVLSRTRPMGYPPTSYKLLLCEVAWMPQINVLGFSLMLGGKKNSFNAI